MKNEFSVAGHWSGGMDEPALVQWVTHLRRELPQPTVSLGLVFMSPQFFPHAANVLEILRVHGQIPLLVGCSSGGLIAGRNEIERDPGLVLGLYHLPGALLKVTHCTQEDVEQCATSEDWQKRASVHPSDVNAWLAFADPFHLDCETWLSAWSSAFPSKAVVGGLASGDGISQSTQLYCNDRVLEEGVVAVAIGGKVELEAVISQGCNPIGETWTVTKVDRNLIHKIGNRPAFEVLQETFESLSLAEKRESGGTLFVGLAVNEYLEEFHRGDFLVRNLLGADPQSGIIAVGAIPRLGQSLQFQHRAAAAGTEDMTALLSAMKNRFEGRTILGGCLCSCNGRGQRLFGEADHDARQVQKTVGPFGLAGFFCNGEIGPIGNQNFIHGYTASLAIFLPKKV